MHSSFMLQGLAFGVGIGGILFAIYIIWQRKEQPDNNRVLETAAQQALAGAVQEVVRSAREQLGAEKKDITETIEKDLREQTSLFKELTTHLKQEIDERQREIRQLEEDRNKKYGQIAQALTDYKGLTEELRGSTEKLKQVLSSNQLRGSWGELQAEKILEAAGMIAGQHYVKQQTIEGYKDLRPDFTIFLPNHLELYVDVKFPLSSLQDSMNATDKLESERALSRFGSDLRERIKEAGKYVLKKEGCVDYVILFVPSESVFEIINKNFPAVVDASFSQQVILVSPHSFFAVVRTIQESYTHFYYEQNLKDILRYLQDLLTNFEKFKGEFAEVGRTLGIAQSKYDQISQTRYKQIARMTDKINQYQLHADEPQLLLPVESVLTADEDPLLTTTEVSDD